VETGVAWVEMVAAVYCGGEDGGVDGVAGGFVEVDDTVKDGVGADPLVNGLADGFAGGAGVSGSGVGRDGGSEDLETVGVSSGGELCEASDEICGGDDIARAGGIVGVANVVDAFEEDNVLYSGGGEDVGVETGEGVGSPAVVEDAVAADSFVDDG